MKAGEISELHLAAIIAGATLLGGILSSVFNSIWLDAGTERQTDVQLVELAIGILSQPINPPANYASQAGVETSQTALRRWAVDTINESAEVQFSSSAKEALINGEASFHGLPVAALIARTKGQPPDIAQPESEPAAP